MISSISTAGVAVSSALEWRDRAGAPAAGGKEPAAGGESEAARGENRAVGGGTTGNGLSPEEQRQVDVLRATDRKVRAHELAHMAAGSGLTGGVSFTYKVGPDKQRYAVGGEVSIDVSSGRDPAETIARARQVRAAALAPADPSPQDRKVAALATKMENSARLELATAEAAPATGRQVSDALSAYRSVSKGPAPTGFSAFA